MNTLLPVSDADANAAPVAQDPYLRLGIATDFIDFDARERFGVVLEVASSADLATLSSALAPQALFLEIASSETSVFATGDVPRGALSFLVGSKLVKTLEIASAFRSGRSEMDSRSRSSVANLSEHVPDAPIETDTVLGVIDDGFPFAHRALVDISASHIRTRVAAIWNQERAPHAEYEEAAPRIKRYGSVIGRIQMNHALRESRRNGGIDEAHAYEMLGYERVRRARTHGAHVLGLLTGNRSTFRASQTEQSAPNRRERQDVLAVQLPMDVLNTPSRAALGRAILDGLDWMLRSASGAKRLVVAIPYGSVLGPHDGTSLFERALDAMLLQHPKMTVFLPSGNSRKWRIHAAAPCTATASASPLVVRLPPESERTTFVEIYLPKGVDAHLKLTHENATVARCAPGELFVAPGAHGGAYAVVNQRNTGRILIRFSPTLTFGERDGCRAGDWHLIVSPSREVNDSKIHAYVSRARGSFGAARRGYQARFVNQTSGAWLADEQGTLSGFATGRAPFIVGGYLQSTLSVDDRGQPAAKPSPYAASGPSRDGRKRVCASAPSDFSAALPGVRSIGTRSGVTWRMDGTSVAAPQLARLFASNLFTPSPANKPGEDVLGRLVKISDDDDQPLTAVSLG